MIRGASLSWLAVSGSLLVAGCATKGFVREQVQASETRVGQDVQRLEGDVGRERTRLGEVSGELETVRTSATDAGRRAGQAAEAAGQAGAAAEAASTRAGQAQTRADEATQKAGQAQARADETDSRLSRLWSTRHKRSLGETVVVTFALNQWQLDDRAQTALLDVARQLQDSQDLIVDLEGHTDSTGPADYNLQLSQRRADAVRRFLVEKGVDLHRIQYIGLGDRRPAADNQSPAGRTQNRRVALKVYTPTN